MRVSKTEFLKMVQESVTKEIYNMLNESFENSLNERFDDKVSAGWQNVKTGVGNIGREIMGQDKKEKIDVNAYSQGKNQARKNAKSNKKLQQVKNKTTRRFQSTIAPILAKHGVDSSGVLKSMTSAIDQNMNKNTTVDMESYRKPKRNQEQGTSQPQTTQSPQQTQVTQDTPQQTQAPVQQQAPQQTPTQQTQAPVQQQVPQQTQTPVQKQGVVKPKQQVRKPAAKKQPVTKQKQQKTATQPAAKPALQSVASGNDTRNYYGEQKLYRRIKNLLNS